MAKPLNVSSPPASLATSWSPKRLLLALFVLSELVLVGWWANSEDLGWISVLVGAVVFVSLVFLRWPWGALLSLIIASALSHSYVQVSGWKGRPEHFVIGLILLVWIVRWLIGKRHSINLSGLDYLVIAYILINYVSSAFMSPAPALTLRWALMGNLAMVPYFLVRFLGSGHRYIQRIFDSVIVVSVCVAGYGLFCFLMNRMFGTAFGLEPGKYGDVPGTHGTLYDSNTFGAYTACCSIMLMALYLFGRKERRRYYLAGFLFTTTGMAISFARSAQLAFLVAILFLLYLAVRKGVLTSRTIMALAAQGAVLVLVASLLLGTSLRSRFETLTADDVVTADSSALGRVIEAFAAWNDIKVHPILGNGTASLQLLFDIADYVPELAGNPYTFIENIVLRILHDTGAVGLGVFLAFVISLAVKIRRLIAADPGKPNVLLIALTAALLVDAVVFQVSDASLFAFVWIQLGLLVSLVLHLERAKRCDMEACFPSRLGGEER